jgi:hypothetical protein
LREQLENEGWLELAKYSMGEGVRKVRFEHPGRLQTTKNRPEKKFIWEHCDADGAWRQGRGRRPYSAYVYKPFRDLDQSSGLSELRLNAAQTPLLRSALRLSPSRKSPPTMQQCSLDSTY